MKIDILTLFPEMFAPLEHSIVGKAKDKGLLDIRYHNFRDYAEKARHVDDEPYGGGQGMLLRAQPIFDCIEALEKKEKPRVLLLDPAGRRFDQAFAEELAQEEQLIFICGHYEGYDERIKTLVTDEVSLGDFVLTGGELAAMTMVDATVRLIPEVIGKEASHQDDSFSSGLLEYPQYTRPYDFRGMVVPDVLMSGHHENIRLWRLEQSLKKTLERRPDLLEHYQMTEETAQILDTIQSEKWREAIYQAFNLMDQGDLEGALVLLDRLEVPERSSAYYDYLSTYGYVYAELGQTEAALASYQLYLNKAQAEQNKSHRHQAYHQLAMVYRMAGDYTAAQEQLAHEEQLIRRHFRKNHLIWAAHLYEVGYLAYLLGDKGRAETIMQKSLDHALQTDDVIAQACAYRGLGEILSNRDYLEKAHALFSSLDDARGAQDVHYLLTNLSSSDA